jgi:hypothetical protein
MSGDVWISLLKGRAGFYYVWENGVPELLTRCIFENGVDSTIQVTIWQTNK